MSAEPGPRDAALRNLRQPLAIALGILVVDQLTKLAVSRRMLLGEQIPVVDGVLNLVHARNPGAAFSFLASAPEWFRGPFFICVTVVAILAVLTVVARSAPEDWLMRLALGGILGGALGNLVDRLLHGEVIDFIDVYWRVHHWPAFNVADSAISISVATIFAQSLFGTRDSSAPTATPPRP